MTINGKRIVLRKPSLRDVRGVFLTAKHKEVARAVPLPYPFTEEEARKMITKWQRLWRAKKENHFIIEDDKTKTIVGTISFMKINQSGKKAEVGYWIGHEHWRMGYGLEAMKLALKYAFSTLKLNRVYAYTWAQNKGSAKLLERSGFKHEGTYRECNKFRGKWDDLLLYGILKREYKN